MGRQKGSGSITVRISIISDISLLMIPYFINPGSVIHV